jgi:nicotinamidase-related amidase
VTAAAAPLALSRSRAALLVVDIQDRLLPAMTEEAAGRVLKHTAILIDAAARLGLPIVVSQQYPKGLGGTAQAIEEALAAAASAGAALHRFDKLEFSAAASPEFAAIASALRRDQWIVTGMETHVCVYQTVRDLVARGTAVHVVADAVCSRAEANWRIGLDLAARAGAIPTSTEVCVFDLLGRAGSEEFKALSKAIR